jgi:DNA-binding NarL/FixJ family response regulator
MIRLIIVDDHELFRLGLKAMLSAESDMLVAGEAGNGAELLSLLETTEADLVLLDIIMPGMNGIETARRLRKKYPALKILVLSSENTREVVTNMIETGIDGFVSKQRCGGAGELTEAIRTVALDDMQYFGKDIAALLYQVYVSLRKRTDATAEFTAREAEIINLCHRGLLSKQIADRLHISIRTVDTHKTHIFEKLGIKSMKAVVRYALEHGIIQID